MTMTMTMKSVYSIENNMIQKRFKEEFYLGDPRCV